MKQEERGLKPFAAFLILVLGLSASLPIVSAQENPNTQKIIITKLSDAELESILRKLQFDYEKSKSLDAETGINESAYIFPLGANKESVTLLNDGSKLSIIALFQKISLQKMNEWNKKSEYGSRAYRQAGTGATSIVAGLDLVGSLAPENISEFIMNFGKAVDSFYKFGVDINNEERISARTLRGRLREIRRQAAKLYLQEQYDQCIEKASAAISSDPEYAPGYRTRGKCYQKKGQYAVALEDLKKAVDLGPNSASSLRSLAWFYATAADPTYQDGEEALKLARQAEQYYKNRKGKVSHVYMRTLAAAFARIGDFFEAMTLQQQALFDLRDRLDRYTPADWKRVAQKKGWTEERAEKELAAYQAELEQYRNNQAHTE